MTSISSAAKIFELSQWQKHQAAMLYTFSSQEYLKGLHRLVTALIDGLIDPLIDTATAQNRDKYLKSARWGDRDTVENWSCHAWPFLKDLQASLTRDIAGRAIERYGKTATNECLRGIAEYSMNWATPEEEQAVADAISQVSAYASPIDSTLEEYFGSGWTDFGLRITYPTFCSEHARIPRFKVRTDVTAKTGKTPPRTGVYVSQDDPNAGLQFAWTGNGGGKLRKSSTLNEIGIAALKFVGREDLWINDIKMFEFAVRSSYQHLFEPIIFFNGEKYPDLAGCAIAGEAFTERPCDWYFVEVIEEEWEPSEPNPRSECPSETVARIPGGKACEQAGYYFTPAMPGSRRYFALGETTSDLQTQYGTTIWQWDADQS